MGWTSRVRQLLVGLPFNTKWLIHSYEHCGVADHKRPMLEMLREGMDHVDRIPHSPQAFGPSGWVRHMMSRLPDAKGKQIGKLPDLLVFVRGTVPADSSALGSERGIASIRDSEFAMWGTHVVELPHSLQ